MNPKVPVHTVAELLAYAKSKGEPIQYGSPGIGTVNHLSGELMAHMARIKMSHVPYRGAAPALSDLLGGHIPLLFSAIPNVHSHIGAGTVRAIAVTSAKRSSLVPDVPPVADTPPRLRRHARLWPAGAGGHAAPDHRPAQPGAAGVLANEAVLKLLRNEGVEPLATTPEEFTAMIDREEPKWSDADQGDRPQAGKIRTTDDMLGAARFVRCLRSRSSPASSPRSARAGAGLSRPARSRWSFPMPPAAATT